MAMTALVQLIALSFLTAASRPAASPYGWVAPFHLDGGIGGDQQLRQDSRGNVLVIGTLSLGESEDSVVLVKYNRAGGELWRRIYHTGGVVADHYVQDSVLDHRDNIYLTVYSYTPDASLTLLKYDSEGNLLWVRNPAGFLPRLAVDPDGNLFGAGTIAGAVGLSLHSLLVKFDPGGTELWRRTFDVPGDNVGSLGAVVTDSAGNVYTGGFEYTISKFDAQGNLSWEKTYNGQSIVQMLFHQNRLYVSGTRLQNDALTVKLDSEGHELWQVTYTHPAATWIEPMDIALDKHGNLHLATRAGVYYGLTKYSADGQPLWSVEEQGIEEGVTAKVGVDRNGDVWLFYTVSRMPFEWDAVLARYDRFGQRRDERRNEGPDAWQVSSDLLVGHEVIFTYGSSAPIPWVTGTLHH